MNKCLFDIYYDHTMWFKKKLIENGAPETITNAQVEKHAGFEASKEAHLAGYMQATKDITREMM